jgi:hypothetical protein
MVSTGAVSSGVSSDLDGILAGRDTRWYKGYHLKLTLILVSLVVKGVLTDSLFLLSRVRRMGMTGKYEFSLAE